MFFDYDNKYWIAHVENKMQTVKKDIQKHKQFQIKIVYQTEDAINE
jgi:hypothetical protein